MPVWNVPLGVSRVHQGNPPVPNALPEPTAKIPNRPNAPPATQTPKSPDSKTLKVNPIARHVTPLNARQGKIHFPVTSTTDQVCSACTRYHNCVYLNSGGGCTRDADTPSCSCVAGFQMVGSTCVQCPAGTWKKETDWDPCITWENTFCNKGEFRVKGTRFSDSKCISYPTVAPANARIEAEEMVWRCDAGYQSMWR
jgi:hypothetical protein